MILAPWPEQLVLHELCEEVSVAAPMADDTVLHSVLLRGLRVKAGIDYGDVRAPGVLLNVH